MRPFLLLPKYDPDAKSLFLRATTQPSSARKKLISNFIKQCKSDSNWNLFDCCWFLAAHAQQFSTLNWKNSNHTITEVNSPTWTVDRGYTGNGTSSYLNSNYNYGTQGINFTQNSASCGAYSRTNNTGDLAEFGNWNGDGTVISGRNSSGNLVYYINVSTADQIAISTSQGLVSIQRTGATAIEAFKNGVSVDTGTTTSTALNDLVNYILAYNSSGTPSWYSSRELSFVFFGSSGINHLKLFNAVETYLDALGAGVI